MIAADILQLPSMPMASPSYPRGPYRFIDREYLIVTYESDPSAIRAALPEPLEPDGSNIVLAPRRSRSSSATTSPTFR
jgi:acetoacetate decarboxylase